MPIRRINYTERRRVGRSDVDIVIRDKEAAKPYFDAAIRLSKHAFPPDAKVFIEAYRQTNLMRFNFGSVSMPANPADRYLTEFQSVEDVLFRLKVTAVSARPGVLLGEAEQIRPARGGRRTRATTPSIAAGPMGPRSGSVEG